MQLSRTRTFISCQEIMFSVNLINVSVSTWKCLDQNQAKDINKVKGDTTCSNLDYKIAISNVFLLKF